MTDTLTHEARVAGILTRFDDTAARLVARLEGAGDRSAPADGGWTPAQIGAHVAMVNSSLASVIDGSGPGATPPPDGFVERAWADMIRNVPERNQAPARFVPPANVAIGDAVRDLKADTAKLRTALSGLTPERSRLCFTHRLFGMMTLYQVGDFAIAHMIRHNQQAKRALGE
jgi:DinB family protein